MVHGSNVNSPLGLVKRRHNNLDAWRTYGMQMLVFHNFKPVDCGEGLVRNFEALDFPSLSFSSRRMLLSGAGSISNKAGFFQTEGGNLNLRNIDVDIVEGRFKAGQTFPECPRSCGPYLLYLASFVDLLTSIESTRVVLALINYSTSIID